MASEQTESALLNEESGCPAFEVKSVKLKMDTTGNGAAIETSATRP